MALAACHAPVSTADRAPPHVLLIVADDLGWADLGTGRTTGGEGSDYHLTPRIDALAARGAVFRQAWASPNCSPGRAALHTGRSATATGVYTNEAERGDPALQALAPAQNDESLDEVWLTLAERLRAGGYRTGHFGKWHLGTDGEGTGPLDQGFDVNVGGTANGLVTGGSDGHFAQSDGSFEGLPGLGENGIASQFSTDRLTDEALDWWLADPGAASFVSLAPFAVHQPVQAPEADLAVFDGAPPGARHDDPVYAAMLYNFDANVGRLLDALDDTADPRVAGATLADTTVVVFTSDNGGVGGYSALGIALSDAETTDNSPLSGGKGTLYEGGLRVPLVVAGPGVPARVDATPVQLTDVVPTVLALAAVGGAPDLAGTALVPIFVDLPRAREHLFLHFPHYLEAEEETWRATPTSVVRDDRYKLWYLWETRSYRLYDLRADPGERTDIAAAHGDVVAALALALREWLVASDAALPLDGVTGEEVALPEVPGC